jgi:hypothetical protein
MVNVGSWLQVFAIAVAAAGETDGSAITRPHPPPFPVPREINHGPPKISNELASHIIPRFTAPVEAMKMATRGRRRLPSSNTAASCSNLLVVSLLHPCCIHFHGVNASSLHRYGVLCLLEYW